jgi:hypothetical protein
MVVLRRLPAAWQFQTKINIFETMTQGLGLVLEAQNCTYLNQVDV